MDAFLDIFLHISIASWLTGLAIIDRDTARLPNRWVVPGIVAVGAASTINPGAGAAAVLAALPYLLGFLGGQCGAGDVKLAFVVGGLVGGFLPALATVLIAQLIALVTGIWMHRRRHQPHGPALCAATVVVLGTVGA